MVISLRIYLLILAGLSAERILELWLSNRNAKSAFAHGGIEYGRAHYPLMAAFHTAFLISCAAESLLHSPVFPARLTSLALAGEVAAQALRYWCVATLGESWNTRIIVIPGREPITSGPYRYIRHPNYAAVALEIACVPLMRGLFITAVVFSVGNILLLAWRIRIEERALGEPYQRAFASSRRFIPRVHD